MATKEAGQDAYGQTIGEYKSYRPAAQPLRSFDELEGNFNVVEPGLPSGYQTAARQIIAEDRKVTGNSFGRASSIEAANL